MHKIAIPQAVIDRVLKRRESLHVFGEVDPTRTAHIVVDLQNEFMAPGQPVEIAAAREIVPNVNRIAPPRGRRRTCRLHPKHDRRRGEGDLVDLVHLYERREAQGERGSSLCGRQLRSFALARPRSPAGRSQGEENPLRRLRTRFVELHAILQERNIDTLIITGTATNVCCESTARDAMMMNYKVIFVSDGTATHTDEEHNATLGTMVANFADVMSTNEVVACLARTMSHAAE